MEDQKINLNFLRLTQQDFNFIIYRKEYVEAEINEHIHKYSLPQVIGSKDYINFNVSFEPTKGYEEFLCNSFTNIKFTLKALYFYLVKEINQKGIDISLGEKFYDRSINFTIKTHERGREIISLDSYYLKEESTFGFLISSRFKVNDGEKLDKELLILTSSLNKYGQSNRDFYSDKFHKIQGFIDNFLPQIANFKINGIENRIESTLLPCRSGFLNKKEYRFKNNQPDHNQFNGLRRLGPFEEVNQKVKYVFIFEEKFKSFANNLYLSLVGKSNPGTFSGMTSFFGLPFGTSDLHKVVLKSYSKEDVINASKEVIEIRNVDSDFKVIAIFLEPDRFDNITPYNSPYYNIKYYLTKENIPVQVVRDDKINNANTLKWSTSNIALQIFSKLGGTPWILKPSQNECLILGIGSSYEKREDGSIKKYFAYSVCVDSTGLYKKLDILAEETTKEKYLRKLGENLVDLFKTPEYENYKKCALHISESVTHEAISTIQIALTNIANVEFKVLKFNTKNKFFGFSSHNTYVPYESAYIKLSSNEYLVWFDGLVRGKENIYQKIGNPIHIKFLRSDGVSDKNDLEYLQDAINLSGANWRGFNAKQTPISIYYAKIVADYTSAFNNFEEFDKTHFSNNLPWFL